MTTAANPTSEDRAAMETLPSAYGFEFEKNATPASKQTVFDGIWKVVCEFEMQLFNTETLIELRANYLKVFADAVANGVMRKV